MVAGASTVSDVVRNGGAYVLVRNDHVWSEEQRLIASDPSAVDYFGCSVSVEGDTLVVGSRGADLPGLENAGAAYVFVRSASTWSEQQKLTRSPPGAHDYFGASVALSGDLAAIGTRPGDNIHEALVFQRSGVTWSQDSIIVGGVSSGSDFGESVAISDGWLVVGALRDAPFTGDSNERAGSVTIFRPSEADLGITKDDGQSSAMPGQPLAYTVTASNPIGPDDAIGAAVTDVFPSDLSGCFWTCVWTGGATCTASGSGDIADTVDLPVGGVAVYPPRAPSISVRPALWQIPPQFLHPPVSSTLSRPTTAPPTSPHW